VPELPDVELYVESIAARVTGDVLERVRVGNPFLVRTFDPPLSAVNGKRVLGVRRMAKRIVLALEEELFVVIHLMIAGRFRWKEPGTKLPGKLGLAAFDFTRGTLILTEAGTKRRASLHVVRGEAALRGLDPGGIDVFSSDVAAFKGALQRERHTLKRTLTDPHLFSGIGNAYSDEILWRAKLSPVSMSTSLDDAAVLRLFDATKATLREWLDRLRAEAKGEFPEKVTAFRDEMAVHGKYGKPCPACGSAVQRIRYSENEANYCARCQTAGKLLADRALSRLLKGDWPKSLDELEERKSALTQAGGGPVTPPKPTPSPARRRAGRAPRTS
jgi:formamidopyrimidine-DNA glycosylase